MKIRESLTWIWAIALLVLFPVLAFWQAALMDYTLKWDAMDQFFQHQFFICECFSQNQLPLWNPYQHLGLPFYADPLSGFWYPVSWIVGVVMPCDARAINVVLILHIVIGGLGMYRLLRGLDLSIVVSLCFALAYESNGVFVGNAQHIPYVVAAAWLPWLMDAFLRLLRYPTFYHAILLGGVTALFVTGGYPAFTLILAYFLIALWAVEALKNCRNKQYKQLWAIVGYSSLAVGIALILASGFVYSFVEAYPETVRHNALSIKQILFGAFSPNSLISSVLPYAVSADTGHYASNVSMINGYMGLLTAIFWIPSLLYGKWRYKGFFVFMALTALLAAFGDATPVREWMANLLPGLDRFRFPSTFRLFWILGSIVIAAQGLHSFISHYQAHEKPLLPKRIIAFLGLGIAVSVVICFLYGAKVSYPPLFNMRVFTEYYEGLRLKDLVASQGVLVLAMLAILYWVLYRKQRLPTTALLIGWVVVELLLSTQLNVPATVVSHRKMHRYLSNQQKLPDGFPIPSGYILGSPFDTEVEIWPTYYNHNVLFKQVGLGGFNPFELKVYSQFKESACASVAWQKPIAFLENDAGQLLWQQWRPGFAALNAETEKGDKLVLSQIAYKGWKVAINGEEVPIEPYCGALVSISLPRGTHQVGFYFHKPVVKVLFWTTVATFSIWLVALVVMKRGSTPH